MNKTTTPNLWLALVLLLFVATQSGCSLPNTKTDAAASLNTPRTFKHADEWHTPLKADAGKMQLTGSLASSTRSLLVFKESLNTYANSSIQLTFSDADCVGQHQLQINFWDTPKSIYSIYSKTKINWNQPFTLQVDWQVDGNVTVSLNDEKFTFKTTRPIKYFSIKNHNADFALSSYSYTPLNN